MMTTKFVAGYFYHQIQNVKHKAWVAWYMVRFSPIVLLHSDESLLNWIWRAIKHDWSKFTWVESAGFAQTIFELKNVEYGTPEYRALLHSIRPAIDAHQLRNDHHPEYWEARIIPEVEPMEAMPLICKMEMICDWAAAVRRNKNGSMRLSIDRNAERFGYGYGSTEWLRFSQWAMAIGGRGAHDPLDSKEQG